MTLDEAIQHCKEVVNEEKSKLLKVGEEYICSECAEEHEQLAEWLEELKEYKELEEQGLLLKLPCKVGDIIYDISTFVILSYKVESFKMLGNRVGAMRTSYIINDTLLFSKSYVSDIGKTVFLTKEEAEQELKRLESAE